MENIPIDVIKEGNLIVLPGEGLVDTFKSEKKRFCVLRRSDEGKVFIEVHKQQQQPQSMGAVPIPTSVEVKSASIKATKKGKVLQVHQKRKTI